MHFFSMGLSGIRNDMAVKGLFKIRWKTVKKVTSVILKSIYNSLSVTPTTTTTTTTEVR